VAPRGRNTDDLVVRAIVRAREAGVVRQRDLVVVVAGVPAGVPGHSNLVKVEIVGRPSKP
jgi:pyruvate kinase